MRNARFPRKSIVVGRLLIGALISAIGRGAEAEESELSIEIDAAAIRMETPLLEAAVRKKGYVSGVMRQSLVDKQTGFCDAGFGLDIADWIMEPGSDRAYRDKLDPLLLYEYDNAYHGKRAKRCLEGPQICTKAKELSPRVVRGPDFIAIEQSYQYTVAAPGKKTGSRWTQVLVFPHDTRYFFSMDRVDAVNDSEAMFLRIDMPGHIRHQRGDTFMQVYLSYHGKISASSFLRDFAPDEAFHYRRDSHDTPERFIRAYQLRDAASGEAGPWLAGMTLEPSMVHEAWCHQRGYVCMIQEIGGRPIEAGESFRAAFVVGYFDSVDEMNNVYDRHKGHTGIELTDQSWRLTK
jgi:hypothetical protein